jgi:N-acetyl-anhydromuramyl-L-alanine amidase AmpD
MPTSTHSTPSQPKSGQASGCLYDGSAEVKVFSEEELEQVKSALPPETKDAKGGFTVITRIRSANFSTSTQMSAPFGIVLHHTGGRFESDLATLTKEGTGVSANDFIDKQGRIFELCEFPKRAWHAGEADLNGITDWNAHGWGIEIENLGTGGDPYPPRQIDAIVWRCRERRRRLGVEDRKMLTRHRDVCMPRGRKSDTSDNFPYEEIRRRVFAKTDPTDQGIARGELKMEKYNIAGLDRNTGLIAAAFAGTLRAEGVDAMAIHSGANVEAAAGEAAVAEFRSGPRLVAIGGKAAKAVTRAGQKLGTEDKSDLFGAIGDGAGEAQTKDMLAKAEDLLVQICKVEKTDPKQAKARFEQVLVALAPELEDLV